MTGALTISLDGLHAEEIRAIREACDRGLRNAEIRARYAELKPRIGQVQALEEIGEEYDMHPKHVGRIVYVRGRAV